MPGSLRDGDLGGLRTKTEGFSAGVQPANQHGAARCAPVGSPRFAGQTGQLSNYPPFIPPMRARIRSLLREGMWPPLVPSVLLVECLQGHAGRDAPANQFIKTCDVVEEIPESLARRAARLRRLAKRGSAVDALVVALAEPEGTALTSDPSDLEALAAHAVGVIILTA